MNNIIKTATTLYKIINNISVDEQDLNNCMVTVFNFGSHSDKDKALNRRNEIIKSVQNQPRLPGVLKQWKKHFSLNATLTEQQANEFVCDIIGTVEDVNHWMTTKIMPGSFSNEANSLSDFNAHISKSRPGWLLHLTTKGRGRYHWLRQDLITEPGDLVLLAPDAFYDIKRDKSSKRWDHHYIHFPVQSHWLQWLQWPEIGPGIHFLSVKDDRERNTLLTLFEEIIQLDVDSQDLTYDLMQNLLEQLLIRCRRLAMKHQVKPTDKRIVEITAYINQHYDQAISVESLADRIGLSPSRLATLFKKQTGTSLLQWRDEQRMVRACHLLMDTQMQLSVIADALGYNDPLYFSRCFRQHLGCSPSQYRKERQFAGG